MTNYYVSSSDGNDGDSGLTPASAFATLAAGNSAATSGDTLLFRRGDTFEETGLTSLAPGRVFEAYGSGARPIFRQPNGEDVNNFFTAFSGAAAYTFSDIEFDVNGANQATSCMGFTFGSTSKDITLTNCVVRNVVSNTATVAHGFNFIGATANANVVVTNCEAYTVDGSAFRGEDLDGYSVTGCTIDDVGAGVQHAHVLGGGDNILIQNNTITRAAKGTVTTGADNSISVGCDGDTSVRILDNHCSAQYATAGGGRDVAGLDVFGATPADVLCSGNTFDGSTMTAEYGMSMRLEETATGTFENNTVIGAPHVGVWLGGGTILCRGNTVSGCGFAATSSCAGIAATSVNAASRDLDTINAEITNNLIYDCYRGVQVSGADGTRIAQGTLIAHNTIVNSDLEGIWINQHSADTEFRDNIIESSGSQHIAQGATGVTGTVADTNLYEPDGATAFDWEGTSSAFTAWKANSSLDAASLAASPEFFDSNNDDFRLYNTSPAVDAASDGLNIGYTEETVLRPVYSSATTTDGADATVIIRGSKLFDIEVSGISGHTVELQRSPDGGTTWNTVESYTTDIEKVAQNASIKDIRLKVTVAGTGYPTMTLVGGNAV